MRLAAALFLFFAVSLLAKKEQGELVEKRDVPLATVTISPKKVHEVRSHYRLAYFSLKVRPVMTETLSHTDPRIGLEVSVSTTWGDFNVAGIVMTVGESQTYSQMHDWVDVVTGTSIRRQTTISDLSTMLEVANAKIAYLTVTFPGSAPPFDHMSFQLSKEQIDDLRLILGRYNSTLNSRGR